MGYLGWKRTKGTEDYMLAGQKAILPMPWQVVDPLVIALPLSILALAVVWAIERMTVTRGEDTTIKAG